MSKINNHIIIYTNILITVHSILSNTLRDAQNLCKVKLLLLIWLQENPERLSEVL